MTGVNKEFSLPAIIITSLLTGLLTYVVTIKTTNQRLEKEQDYWTKRYVIERVEKITDKRYEFLERINSEILNLEVKAKEIKLYAARIKGESCLKEQLKLFDIVNPKMMEYNVLINESGSTLQMVSLLFGEQLKPEIDNISAAMNKNYKISFESNPQITDPLDYFKENFDTIDELQKTRPEFIKRMYEIINSDQEKVFKAAEMISD